MNQRKQAQFPKVGVMSMTLSAVLLVMWGGAANKAEGKEMWWLVSDSENAYLPKQDVEFILD